MCGIVGAIHKQTAVETRPLQNALEVLRPRGPDHAQWHGEDHWAFGHTRLSIIDLSSNAHQPMVLPQEQLTITYNGEIYNYRELKAELESAGVSFKTHSDTEVLAKAYRHWGPDFLKRLHGMFALVIFDQKNQTFFMARDRFGIKPLYYFQDEERFLFASNIRALTCFPGISREIDPQALHFYMSLHAIVPAPATIFKKIKKLPAAHGMILDQRGAIQRLFPYWEASYTQQDPTVCEDEWEERLTQALHKAVERRLVADVPVGLFLSGGVDSSLITALMAPKLDRPLETFSVGFGSSQGEDGNEFRYSDLVAQTFQTNHHKIQVSTEEMLANLDDCIKAMNEPMVSYDNIGFYLLSKYSAQQVKVVQSGQGADEVFGGYHWYQKLAHSKDGLTDYARLFLDRSHQQLQEEILTPAWQGENVSYAFLREQFGLFPQLHPVDQALRLDTHTMLVEDPVKRVDSNTMAWSLEARVPFLDHELVELAAQIPYSLQIKDGGKYFLKKIAKKFIPAEVIDRPKGYFPVPQLKYIEGPFLDYVKQFLTPESVAKRGIFQWSYIEKLMANPKQYITPLNGSELWQIAVLEKWLQTFDS